MATQIFSRLELNRVDPSLLIGQGGYTLTTLADSLSNARKAMGSLPKGVGVGYLEVEIWSTSLTALGTDVSVGVAQANSTVNTGTGVDALSWGYFPGDGSIKNNNANVASSTAAVQAERNVIQVYTELTPTLCRMSIAVNGSFMFFATLPNGKFWVPSFTVSGSTAGDRNIYVNSGLTGFKYIMTQVPA